MKILKIFNFYLPDLYSKKQIGEKLLDIKLKKNSKMVKLKNVI